MKDDAPHLHRRAGTGASEQADRAADRARQLREQLTVLERQEKAWRAGSEGERLVAEALKREGWPALHDQPWPGRQRANIDHLVFAPERIWLVDAKHWSGEVVVDDGVLRQNRYSRDMAVKKAKVAAADVSAALGDGAPLVFPMLCLTSSGADLPATMVDGVVLVGLQHLTESLGSMRNLDLELALLMAKVPERLSGTATTVASHSTTPPQTPSVPATYLRQRTPKASVPLQKPTAALIRSRARPSRSRRSPSIGRLFVALVILGLMLWATLNLTALLELITPLTEWFVSQLMPD